MKRSKIERAPRRLGHKNSKRGTHLENRLTRYGLAAGALLASGSAAQATVISWDSNNDPFLSATTASNGSLFFDMQTGVVGSATFAGADFRLKHGSINGVSYYSGNYHLRTALGFGLAGGAIAGTGGGALFKLPANAAIGGSGNFVNGSLLGRRSFGTIYSSFSTSAAIVVNNYYGNWLGDGSSGFLGLRFTDVDGTHYGWAQIAVNSNYQMTLQAFGYETNPDQAIAAGQTNGPAVPDEGSTLALLALGAVGVLAFRARTKSAVA